MTLFPQLVQFSRSSADILHGSRCTAALQQCKTLSEDKRALVTNLLKRFASHPKRVKTKYHVQRTCFQLRALRVVVSFVLVSQLMSTRSSVEGSSKALAANTRPQQRTNSLQLASKSTSQIFNIDFNAGPNIKLLTPPKSVWNLQLIEKPVTLKPTKQTLKRRLEATLRNSEFAEEVRLEIQDREFESEVIKLATDPVRELFSEQNQANSTGLAFLKGVEKRLKGNKLKLDARDLSWVDLGRLSNRLKARSVQPQISVERWQAAVDSNIERENLELHFGKEWPRIKDAIAEKIYEGQNEMWDIRDMESVSLYEFLPQHIQEIYGRFSSYRGRNCFATALLFSNSGAIADRTVNIIREADHHYTMINSDEFFNTLRRGYQLLTQEEVNAGLRYGDLVAFVDRANGDGFKSLLHAAIHIAGPYYFHKPSKSASTPVEFTHWNEIIKAWTPFAKDLSYDVYRKLPISSSFYLDNTILDEKINWTP